MNFRSLQLTRAHLQTLQVHFHGRSSPLCISYLYHSGLCVISSGRGLLGVDPWLPTCCSFCLQPVGEGQAQLLCLLQGDNGVLVKPRVLSHCHGPCSCLLYLTPVLSTLFTLLSQSKTKHLSSAPQNGDFGIDTIRDEGGGYLIEVFS